MSEECTHDCSTCKSDCSAKEDNHFKTNNLSKVKKTIGVFSAKGGVGKSSVTAMLAVLMNRRGHKTAVLDADLTGPSIPKAFGLKNGVEAQENMIFPAITKKGIEVMSINLLLEDEGSPVIWRGPVLGGVIRQFYEETCWNEVDYMFVDMPPGTGDVPLTVFQSVQLDGIIIVTTPQDLVSMVVDKAINMARMMNIKPEINVLGMTVDEATSLVDRFLDDALMAHLHRVIIIHGKGTGALRKGIHQFLKSQPHVKSFRLGEFGEGDAGVTIVEL